RLAHARKTRKARSLSSIVWKKPYETNRIVRPPLLHETRRSRAAAGVCHRPEPGRESLGRGREIRGTGRYLLHHRCAFVHQWQRDVDLLKRLARVAQSP